MDLLILFAVAFGASAISTPLLRRLALGLGIIDRPGPRKIHSREVPYLGGVAFFLSLVAVLLVVFVYYPGDYLENREQAEQYVALVLGALFVVLLGLYDDVHGTSAWVKLPCQILIGVFMYRQGFSIGHLSNPFDFAGGGLDLSSIGLGVTVLWYVGLMNGVNLIDGLDGLAAGVVAIATGSLLLMAVSDQNVPVSLLSLIILGSTLGFLPYNFPPARIFMGDTGSLLLGFLVASAGILGETKGNTVVAMVIPLIALGVTLLDTAMAFLRRLLHRQHPFRADQQHIHHRLLQLGLSQRQVVLVIYYCSVLFGLASYLLSRIEIRYSLLTGVILLLSLFLGIHILGFVERATRGQPTPAKPRPEDPPDASADSSGDRSR